MSHRSMIFLLQKVLAGYNNKVFIFFENFDKKKCQDSAGNSKIICWKENNNFINKLAIKT